MAFHLLLSFAISFASPQVFPSLMSVLYARCSLDFLAFNVLVDSTSRLCLVVLVFGFLRVCPNQFHLYVPMVVSTGCCLMVFLHKFELLMVSGHLIPRMFLRHLFTKTWIDFMELMSLSRFQTHTGVLTCWCETLSNLSLVLVLNSCFSTLDLKWQKLAAPSFFLPRCLHLCLQIC